MDSWETCRIRDRVSGGEFSPLRWRVRRGIALHGSGYSTLAGGGTVQDHSLTCLRAGGRIFWGVMVAAHLPGLAGCWRALAAEGATAAVLESCVLLTLSMAFFALKLADAPFLRFRVDRRSVVALCVLVGFLHFDVLRSGDAMTFVPETTSLLATSWVVGGKLALRRELARGNSDGCRRATALHALRTTDTVWTDGVHPRCWLRSMHIFSLRAPPA